MAITMEGRLINNPVTGLVNWASPIDDFAGGTVQVGTSDDLSSAIAWESGQTRGTAGRVQVRARGLNIAFRRNVPASTTGSYLNGIDHIVTATGGRK